MTPRPPVRGGGRPPEPRKGAPKNPRPRSTSSRGTEVPLRTAPEGLGGDQESNLNQANLLAGDAIINYRTVASFGHQEKIVRDFSNLLEHPKA